MPRKTKDSENKEIETKEKKATATKKASTATKKTATKKTTTTKKTTSVEKPAVKKTTAKKTSTKKATAEKEPATTKKATTTKKTSTTKKSASVEKPVAKKSTTAKKATVKKASDEKKATTAKKTAATKKATTSKKASTTKKAAKTTTKKPDVVEYYDLPYRYNQTVVKILAQTPTSLFIYWDISDADRENYKKQYGENFFETTKPILKIYNDTLHYEFEVDINDFANSWYLHINDSKCDYRVELARRPIDTHSNINSQYIYISSSNEIESPNDKILFNTLEKMIYFRNTKTNVTTSKSVVNLSFIKNMGKIYNIYDLYKELYKDEDIDNFSNPSSGIF